MSRSIPPFYDAGPVVAGGGEVRCRLPLGGGTVSAHGGDPPRPQCETADERHRFVVAVARRLPLLPGTSTVSTGRAGRPGAGVRPDPQPAVGVTAAQIDSALSDGKNLLVMPGVHRLDQTLRRSPTRSPATRRTGSAATATAT